jgi:hypothetical protein
MKKSLISRPFPRRDFLKFGSFAILGAAASTVAPRSLFAAAAAEAAANSPLLGIGYASSVPTAGSAGLGDAGRLMMGDSLFAVRGARIVIGPAGGPISENGNAIGHSLDFLYPVYSFAPGEYPSFRAWSYAARTPADYTSPRVRFNMPVTSEGLQMSVRRFEPAAVAARGRVVNRGASAVEESTVVLSLGSTSGTPKLQPGVYVIALREKSSDTIDDWSRYSISRDGGNVVVNDAPFRYVAMTVDYA